MSPIIIGKNKMRNKKRKCVCTSSTREYITKVRRFQNKFHGTTHSFVDNSALGDEMNDEILHEMHKIFLKHYKLYQKKISEETSLRNGMKEKEKEFIEKWNDSNIVSCYCVPCKVENAKKNTHCSCFML